MAIMLPGDTRRAIRSVVVRSSVNIASRSAVPEVRAGHSHSLVCSFTLRRLCASRHNDQMPLTSPQIPASIILLVTGSLACFMGYRLFRWLLALYGFVGCTYLASFFVGTLEPWAAAATIIASGLVGAAILILVYLAGLATLGAGLGVLAISLVWTPQNGDAEVWVVVCACLVGAIVAISLRRYVIIVGTSFGGAWTTLVGALALGGDARAVAVAGGDLWQIYPMAPVNGQVPFALGWFGLSLLAALVQLRATSSATESSRANHK